MGNRNVVELTINFNTRSTVTYEEGLEAIINHPKVKELGLKYIFSVNQLVSLLEISRAALERNILENKEIETGVRHLYVTGDNFPQTRIYIDSLELVKYLVEYCELTFWKKVMINENSYEIRRFNKDNLTVEDMDYLAKSLAEGRFKSSKALEYQFSRTRRIVSRLTNIIDTVTFAFPGSQRQLRRFVLTPNDDKEKVENYFTNYKMYENMMKLK